MDANYPAATKPRKSTPLTDEPTLLKSGLVQQRGQLAQLCELKVKTVAGVPTLVDPALAGNARYSVVVEGGVAYDAYLTQVDAEKNCNKMYLAQLLVDDDGEHAVWTRWGRVGEQQRYQNALKSAPSKEAALKVFLQTFKSKTGVGWPDRANATPGRKGKYALVARTVLDAAVPAMGAAPAVEAERAEERAAALRGGGLVDHARRLLGRGHSVRLKRVDLALGSFWLALVFVDRVRRLAATARTTASFTACQLFASVCAAQMPSKIERPNASK